MTKINLNDDDSLDFEFFFKLKIRKTFQYRCAIQLGLGLDAVLDGRHFADGLASGVNPCMIDLRHGRVPLQVFERRLATLQPMIAQQHSIMKTKHLHFVDCFFLPFDNLGANVAPASNDRFHFGF